MHTVRMLSLRGTGEYVCMYRLEKKGRPVLEEEEEYFQISSNDKRRAQGIGNCMKILILRGRTKGQALSTIEEMRERRL